jgi:hypothetical protein
VLDWIAPDLRVLAVPVADLVEAPDNARKHRDRDLDALAESLARFGQRKPIVAKREYRGVRNAVIAGNGTLQAARRLGWPAVAVAWWTGGDAEAREYAISDNRTAELSTWDPAALANLQADGLDLRALWHDDADLGALLGDAAPVPTFQPEPDEAAPRLDQLAPVLCPHCGRDIRGGIHD